MQARNKKSSRGYAEMAALALSKSERSKLSKREKGDTNSEEPVRRRL